MKSRTQMAAMSAIGLVLVAGAAIGTAREPETDPYEPCSRIVDNASRLQCFDATYARESVARVERRQDDIRRTKDDFGLTGAQIDERERERQVAARPPVVTPPVAAPGTPSASTALPPIDRTPDEIEVTITEVLTDARGNYVFLLSNSQVWRATAAKNYRGIVRAGWKARIAKGSIGGFRMSFEGRTGFLGVERVR